MTEAEKVAAAKLRAEEREAKKAAVVSKYETMKEQNALSDKERLQRVEELLGLYDNGGN